MAKKFYTAESVCEGHPDKLCDLIADTILDACLRQDSQARVACEVLATKGKIIVAGEITCNAKINLRELVKATLQQVGYDSQEFGIKIYIHQQSPDIARGMGVSLETRMENKNESRTLGAGDQGIMYGYATMETPEMLPLPVVLVNRITQRLDHIRHQGWLKGIKADGKAQVTLEYENGIATRVQTVIVSVQHDSEKTYESLCREIRAQVLLPCFKDFPLDNQTEVLINPAGRFVVGGPAADTGLTGRKIMVDSYGGLAAHGGGAFSGKDPTKVDRSAAYMARNIAKHIVACEIAERCQISIAYAIGKADPLALEVETFGTGVVSEEILRQAINRVWSLRPAAIIESLDLRKPRYTETSRYGHFGKSQLPWEQCLKMEALKKAVEQLE